MSDNETATGRRGADFMRDLTKLAKKHGLSPEQTIVCFGYITRLMVECETTRQGEDAEPSIMARHVHAFMSGMGAQCEFGVENDEDSAASHRGATLQ